MKSIRFLCLAAVAVICSVVRAADTDYTNEAISITWSMLEGEENSAAVLSDKKTIQDYSWSTGSGINITSAKTKTVNSKTFTEFYTTLTEGNTDAKQYNSIYYIEWTLTPYDALTFQPTQVTVNAAKFGTNNPNMYVYLVDGEGEIHELAAGETMGRQDSNNDEDVVRIFDASACAASKNAVTLRICIDKFPYNKQVGFANVKIEGTVTGTSHYREEYAVNIAPNNEEWGSVHSSRSSVVEGTAVTLTATPNRGYSFKSWVNTDNEEVSTDQAYTFTPEANINLTAVFEPLAEYQVNVVSNIDGAGNISVTTFEDGKYYEGDVIEISALPNIGYVFNNWSDEVSTWQRASVTLTSDIDLTANFEAIKSSSAYVRWPLQDNTDAESSDNVTGSFSVSSAYDSGSTVTIAGHTMRMFTANDNTGNFTFTVNASPEEGQVFVVRSIEFDAARAGSSSGTVSISVSGSAIASDIYIGSFEGGVDQPYQHFYYNLGESMEFSSSATLYIDASQMSNVEGKGIAFGNVIIQGYYKTKQVKVTVPSIGYTTYSSPYAISFDGSGLTAYVAQYDNSEVSFSQISSVPENTGLLIRGTSGSYMVDVIDIANTVDDNVLQPCIAGMTLQPTEDEVQNMAFINKTTGLGFHTFTTERTLNVNTAYMQLPSAAEINFVSAPNQSFTFDENAVAMSQASAKGATATVKRTIASGEWSTICLPFSMNATQTRSAFGNSVQLAKFVKYETNAAVTNISVIFEDVNLSSEGFAANTPYIIKTAKNISQFTVNDVDIEPDEDGTKTEYSEGSTVLGTFKGTYRAQITVPENALFLSDNLFWYSVGLTQMKAFRAYFDFVDVLADMDNSANGITISLDGEATGIGTMQGSSIKAGKTAMYNLQGQRITKPAKGVFIMDGKKIVIE